MKRQGFTRSLFRFYFIYLYTISNGYRDYLHVTICHLFIYQFGACLLPTDLLNFVLGLNRSFLSSVHDNPRLFSIRDYHLSIYLLVMVLLCFCIPRPVCPSLPQYQSRTITGDLFATICTDTPTLFSASPFPVQPRLSILHLVIIRFTISRYIFSVDGDKAWSTIILFNSHFHFFHVLISYHSYAL